MLKQDSVLVTPLDPAFLILMFLLKQVPLFKLLLYFSFGIILGRYLPSFRNYIPYILMLLVVFVLILVLIAKKGVNSLFSFVMAFLLTVLGILSYISNDERNKKNHFSNYINMNIGKVHSICQVKELNKTKKGVKLSTKLNSVIDDSDTIEVSGNLLVYLKGINGFNTVDVGDLIDFESYVSLIKPEQNPLAFSPRDYYHDLNIHYKSYIKMDDIKIKKSNFYIPRFFRLVNLKIQKIINENIDDRLKANIIISIMLGDKQNLDKGILDSFATTGTRHILTVSGMHVGIVALILNFLFSLIKINNRGMKILKVIMILVGIWFYAFLTGAGSAVLRSAFMISLLLVGVSLRRTTNTFNLLFGSAIILLVINPFQLFQLSFILSYIAILSILLFYKPINSLVDFSKYRVLDVLWQFISLSFAAQILIFPLSIYYFHTAPSLFILTALISTPLAFAAIIFGFLIVVSYFVMPFAIVFLSGVIEIIIGFSLNYIKFVESISINIGDHLYFELMDIVILFSAIAFLSMLLKTKQYYYGIYTIVVLALLVYNQNSRILKSKESTEIVIYSTYKSNLIDVFFKGKCYSFQGDNFDSNQIKYSAKNYRLYKSAKLFKKQDFAEEIKLVRKSNIIRISDKTIVQLSDNKSLLPKNDTEIDILLLSDDVKFELSVFLEKYKVNQLVLMKGMKYKTRKYWSSQAEKMDLRCWDINDKGAFINKIKMI